MIMNIVILAKLQNIYLVSVIEISCKFKNIKLIQWTIINNILTLFKFFIIRRYERSIKIIEFQ